MIARGALCWLVLFAPTASVVGAQGSGVAGCVSASRAASRVRLYLEPVAVAKRDRVQQVRICLGLPSGTQVGSFHLELEYDSTIARATGAQPAPQGTQATNTLVSGRVAIAGAAPSAFARGTLSTLSFQRHGTSLGAMRLTLRELNGIDGRNLLAGAEVRGIGTWVPGASPHGAVQAGAPALARLDPERVAIVPGGVAEVMIRGSGFTERGNVVMFGGAVLGELRSADGSSLRLLVPNSWPSSGEAPPRQIEGGTYTVQIRNARGLSNTILLTVVNP